VDVFRLAPCGVGFAALGPVGRNRLWGSDDFNVHPCAKGLQMRDYEVVIWNWACGGEEGGELSEAESGEDGGHVGVVGEVEVEGLV